MTAAGSSRHFSWSFKLSTFIIVNDIKAMHEILRGDDHLNNHHLFI